MEDLVLTTNQIVERLNKGEYDDLAEFLQAIDWTQIAPETIIPKLVLRKFVRNISNKDVRLAVMEFLSKFAHDYFYDGAKRMEWTKEVEVDVEDEEDFELYAQEAASDIQEFKAELNFQIDLVKSKDYPGVVVNRLKKQRDNLEKEVNELKDENNNLKIKIDRYEHPYRHGLYIPVELQTEMFVYIMQYLYSKQIVIPRQDRNEYGLPHVACYRWDTDKVSKALFGYFVIKVSDALNLKKGRDTYRWDTFKPAFINYDELIKEARKAISTFKNQKTKIEDSEIIDQAIEFAAQRVKSEKP